MYCADTAFRSFIPAPAPAPSHWQCPGPHWVQRPRVQHPTEKEPSNSHCKRHSPFRPLPLEMGQWAMWCRAFTSFFSGTALQHGKAQPSLFRQQKPCWARLIGMSKEFIGPFCCQNGKAKRMLALEDKRHQGACQQKLQSPKPGSEKHVLFAETNSLDGKVMQSRRFGLFSSVLSVWNRLS